MEIRPFLRSIKGPQYYDATDPALPKAALAQRKAIDILMEFELSELERFHAFQPVCRKLLPTSEDDADWNDQLFQSEERIRTGGDVHIRLRRRLEFTRIKASKATIAAPLEREEYVLDEVSAAAFRAGHLAGYQLLPVGKRSNPGHWEGVFHLFTHNIMPPATKDVSWSDEVPLGCLAYQPSEITSIRDFARTAEPAGEVEDEPLWVISRRVKECYERSKLKGWLFRPVFEAGTAAHREYIEMWQDFRKLVKGCRLHGAT